MTRFQRFSSFDQDSILRTNPRTHHDRSGRGQTQGTRTCDRKNSNGSQESKLEDNLTVAELGLEKYESMLLK